MNALRRSVAWIVRVTPRERPVAVMMMAPCATRLVVSTLYRKHGRLEFALAVHVTLVAPVSGTDTHVLNAWLPSGGAVVAL